MSGPDKPPVFAITNTSAAGTQLETAIQLWFEEKDPTSIHTLAVAAQGILNQMCRDRGVKTSQMNALIEAKPRAFRESVRSPQNFFKHGRHRFWKWSWMVPLNPELTELVMIDCCSMHQRLFGVLTPLMLLFAVRYSLFNPRAFPTKIAVKGIKIEDLRRFTRPQFLKKVFPRFRGKVGELPPLHLGDPPELVP